VISPILSTGEDENILSRFET